MERNNLGMQARNILIATGARAFVPPIEGAEHSIISDEVKICRCRYKIWVCEVYSHHGKA